MAQTYGLTDGFESLEAAESLQLQAEIAKAQDLQAQIDAAQASMAKIGTNIKKRKRQLSRGAQSGCLLESWGRAWSSKLQAQIDAAQAYMAKKSTSTKKRKPKQQQPRRGKSFLWNLSERTTCWPTINRGHLGFHIKGVGTSPPDKDIIHLRSEDLRNLQKALHSGKQGRFILTMEYHKATNAPGGLLETVLQLRMADESADPAEFEPPITYLYPGEVKPNNMAIIGSRRIPWMGNVSLMQPISKSRNSDNSTSLQKETPALIGTITTEKAIKDGWMGEVVGVKQPSSRRNFNNYTRASIELNTQELTTLRQLFKNKGIDHEHETGGEMLVSF